MMADKKPDHFDWFGALDAATRQAREVAFTRALHPVIDCRCGATESRGGDLGEVADLRGQDVTLARNEGIHRCRVCRHAIHHGAPSVTTHMSNTSVVRDRYHPECVVIS